MGKVRTIIDSRGVVQVATTGTPELKNDIPLNTSGFPGTKQTATALSGGTGALGSNITASLPGYYTLHSQCTCSIGQASSFPGAEYLFRVTQGDLGSRPFLTGSAVAGTDKVFWLSGSVYDAMLPQPANDWASRLYLQPRGSLMLKSDGVYWHVLACSGSLSSSVGNLALTV